MGHTVTLPWYMQAICRYMFLILQLGGWSKLNGDFKNLNFWSTHWNLLFAIKQSCRYFFLKKELCKHLTISAPLKFLVLINTKQEFKIHKYNLEKMCNQYGNIFDMHPATNIPWSQDYVFSQLMLNLLGGLSPILGLSMYTPSSIYLSDLSLWAIHVLSPSSDWIPCWTIPQVFTRAT